MRAATFEGVGSSPRCSRAQQRGPQDEHQHRGDDGGDDRLQPQRSAEQIGDETRDAADAEHQEGEREREHLDHQEREDEDDPRDP